MISYTQASNDMISLALTLTATRSRENERNKQVKSINHKTELLRFLIENWEKRLRNLWLFLASLACRLKGREESRLGVGDNQQQDRYLKSKRTLISGMKKASAIKNIQFRVQLFVLSQTNTNWIWILKKWKKSSR